MFKNSLPRKRSLNITNTNPLILFNEVINSYYGKHPNGANRFWPIRRV